MSVTPEQNLRRLLNISAAHGPVECQMAVGHALRKMMDDAQSLGVSLEVLEEYPSEHGWHSVLCSLHGENAAQLASDWTGTIQWNCESPVRKKYPRKNWFIGVHPVQAPTTLPEDNTIVFSTCKSSGKGGQHVNKTESAVHATHVASGISVKVQTERSQFANKKLAKELIALKLAALLDTHQAAQRQTRNHQHWNVQRGNPVKVFKGLNFQEV